MSQQHNPPEMTIDSEPGDLPRTYIRAAQRLGATVLGHTPATGIGTLMAVGLSRGPHTVAS